MALSFFEASSRFTFRFDRLNTHGQITSLQPVALRLLRRQGRSACPSYFLRSLDMRYNNVRT